VVKRRLALGLLGFVALWPLAHRALVARFEIDPWKLSGFAMYATPSLPVLAAVLVPREGKLELLDEAALPVAAREALARFRVERLALGRLRAPDGVARALLAARPDLAGCAVLVQRTTLDPRTARMRRSAESFAYDRGVLD
jgi:hypothetical protein